MQLSELIEQEDIKKISLKTTISQDNLNFLISEDFEKLSRVKALGFLVILEREYKELEVTELRENVKLYFENNKPDHDNVIIVSEVSSTKEGFSFFKWFVILGILFGGWYLYTQGELDSILENITSKKDVYGDGKALENNTSTEEAEKVFVTEDTHEPVSIVAPVVAKIDLEVESEKEENRTIEKFSESLTVEESVAKELAKADIAKVEEVQHLSTQEIVTEVKETKVTEEKEVVPVTAISTITVNPTRGMLWFGFINVDTKKKKEFMKQVSTPFDIKDGRWILVTGHGFVDVVSELETIEVSDRNKHYFYIDSTELKEISQKEFRDLNGGRGWV